MLHLFSTQERTTVSFLVKAHELCVESFKAEGGSDIAPTGSCLYTACTFNTYPVSAATAAVVGTAALYVSDTAAEIWNVAVAPAHRRRGHCRALIKALIHLWELMYSHVPLRIVVHRDNPIQEGYRKMGFTTHVTETPSSIVLQYSGNETK
jgi:ribosomal protein S18 acetylase RimI-like enzyme